MLNTLKSTILSFAIGLGSIAAAPTVASAEGVYFGLGIGDDDGLEVQVQDGYSERRHGRRYQERRYQNEYRRCSPERAVEKARRMGLHRARVVDVDRRAITVSGRADFGDRVLVRFGRAPNCPVIGRFH